MYIPLKPLFSRHNGIGVQFTDEPTGNLDAKSSKEVVDLLKIAQRKYHETVILVTHDQEIASIADRVITIEDGKIIQDTNHI